jgi:hypothetical protein
MPFSSDFDDIYQLGIKAACEEAGAYSIRVDEEIYQGSVVGRIFSSIDKADLIIADMTGKKANVFYETGYAHALGKRVVLLTQDVNDIPFDLKDRPHIIYEKRIVKLKEELIRHVRWYIENPTEVSAPDPNILGYSIVGIPIETKPLIRLELRGSSNIPSFSIDIHNTTGRLVRQRCQFGIVIPGYLSVSNYSDRVVRLPDKSQMFLIDKEIELYPDGWDNVNIMVIPTDVTLVMQVKKPIKIIVRVFTEVSQQEYECSLIYLIRPSGSKIVSFK